MKITVTNEITGRFGLVPKTEVYDAFGEVSGLWIDKQPHNISAERVAVAAVLAFRHRLSGELSFEKPISPATAEAISDFLRPAFVVPNPIEFRPLMLPKGSSQFLVHGPHSEPFDVVNAADSDRSVSLDLRRSDKWTGSMMSMDRLCLASNAWLLAESLGGVEAFYSSLAVAVLFAEDFDVDTIVLPEVVQRELLSPLIRLLSAARLGIRGS